MSAPATVKVYRTGAKKLAKKNKAGNSVEAISFPAERRRLNRAVALEYGDGHLQCDRLLSKVAKEVIREMVQAGEYKDREDRLEPPFMAPSADPEDYSQWCSICNDFGEYLILCAGCRVGICCTSPDITTGCLEWKEIVNNDDFIFYCPFCVRSIKQTCILRLRKDVPHIFDVWFRYDPAVLIIAATWHQTTFSFAEHLHHALSMNYHDSHRSIMRMDVSLQVSVNEPGPSKKGKKKAKDAEEGPVKQVVQFLKDWDTAKIVFVLETHCIETGKFIWTGDSPSTYESCWLREILGGCIPTEVYKYLSDATGGLKHHHRSLILNLSCGPSVSVDTSRASLLDGHCADAVVSCADNSNVVGEIATRLVDFTSRWVRSASRDLDLIVASTLDQEWVLNHKPVLSSKDFGHRLYSKIRPAEPDGKLVLCHQRCGAIVLAEVNSKSKGVKFTCTGCRSTCVTPYNKQSTLTPLSRRGLVRTVYPQELYRVQWMLSGQTEPVEHVATAGPSRRTPANTLPLRPVVRLPSRAMLTRAEQLSREVSPAVSSTPTTPISRASSTSTSDQLVVPGITRSPSLPTFKQSEDRLTITLPPSTSSSPSTPVTSTSPAVGPPRPRTRWGSKRLQTSEDQERELEQKRKKLFE